MNVGRLKPSGTIVIGVVALVVGLGAPAMAHQVSVVAHKISGSSIKPHSIAGNRLKAHTVTGAQINKSKLGTVPTARSARIARTLPSLAWHTITLVNGWVKYPDAIERAPAYAVDAQGVVHFRGAMDGGANDTTAFTLPAGVEPKGLELTLPILCGSNGYVCYIDLQDGGAYVSNSGTAPAGSATNYVSLEGVTFATK